MLSVIRYSQLIGLVSDRRPPRKNSSRLGEIYSAICIAPVFGLKRR